MIVKKWAELVKVRNYFPDLKDVFTPDAVFCIEYAFRKRTQGNRSHFDNYPVQVRFVLVDISNAAANHDYSIGELKRLYNNKVEHVARCTSDTPALPMFDTSETIDRRLSVNKDRFIPKDAPVRTAKSQRQPRRHILAAITDSKLWAELGDKWEQLIQKEGGVL